MNTRKVFEKAVVGGIEMKNRMIRSATLEYMGKDGFPDDRLFKMYDELCDGQVGLIITGNIGFSTSDNHQDYMVLLDGEHSMGKLTELTSAVRAKGTKIVAQINHTSSQIFAVPEGPAYGPSDGPDLVSGVSATALTVEQIRELVREFGAAAMLAKDAGFDGVQLHGAHGYMLDKFLNPSVNKRDDEYGGSLENRSRIIEEVLQEIKGQCGADYPVWIKLNCSDFTEDGSGITEPEFLSVAERLSQKGLDAVEVSGGSLAGKYSPCRSKKHTAYHLDSAKKAADRMDCSVILVGGVRNLETAESILADTKIEAISLSRPLIRQPDLIKNWKEGDRAPVKCVSCNGCFNPTGTKCFFHLSVEGKEVQKPIMKMMSPKND